MCLNDNNRYSNVSNVNLPIKCVYDFSKMIVHLHRYSYFYTLPRAKYY